VLDNLRMHWRMFGRPRFGAAGTFALPYVVFFEALEPLVEVLGFAIVLTLIIENSVNGTYLVAFFLVAAHRRGVERGGAVDRRDPIVAPLTR